jgi:hypothetical protein
MAAVPGPGGARGYSQQSIRNSDCLGAFQTVTAVIIPNSHRSQLRRPPEPGGHRDAGPVAVRDRAVTPAATVTAVIRVTQAVWIPVQCIDASGRRQPRSARSRSTPATGCNIVFGFLSNASSLLVGDNPGQPRIWVSPAPATVTKTVTVSDGHRSPTVSS